ncbi:hypothetical protein Q3O43_29995 (plasmid) [Rhodococcus aetherivorans]|uniref:hypothetical protein n=1 Tax=Rhodococcus aetherivorans TaxID=191292 RepID=UPI0026EDA76F|nr:hypothetical protein [Rhodococcus aetherivorans]WKX02131.1 hypothetical protein Q3O43_29995 [Rhodococcus aetherivorans]
MNKFRATVTVALVGLLSLVSTGVASANPPGPDPLAGVPEPLRSVAAAAMQLFAGVWNTLVALVDLVGFGSG